MPAANVNSQTISDTDTHSFKSDPGTTGAHVTITGAGSGSAQPVFRDSNADHQAYTIADDTYRLTIPYTESIDITASGGDIWAQVAFFKDA